MNAELPNGLIKLDFSPEIFRSGLPCIYFLFYQNEVVYIGKAQKGVLYRIASHIFDKVFDEIKYLPLPHAKRLSGYEDAYINMFLPKYNSVQTWGLSEPERRIFKKCSSKEEAVKLIFERRKEFMEKHSGKLGNSLPKP